MALRATVRSALVARSARSRGRILRLSSFTDSRLAWLEWQAQVVFRERVHWSRSSLVCSCSHHSSDGGDGTPRNSSGGGDGADCPPKWARAPPCLGEVNPRRTSGEKPSPAEPEPAARLAQAFPLLGDLARTQKPWLSIWSGTLNLLRKFSRATAAVSSTIWASSKCPRSLAKSSSLTR